MTLPPTPLAAPRESGWSRAGGNAEPPDPLAHPEYFEGILLRRMAAFLIDGGIILLLLGAAYVAVGLLGVLSFGLLWGPLMAATILVPFAYHALLIGGPRSATLGMRALRIEVRRWDGGRPSYLQALVMTLLFYGSIGMTTFLVLVVALFTNRRRCLHDYLSGTLVVNVMALQGVTLNKR